MTIGEVFPNISISIVAFAAIFAMAFLRLEAVFPPSALLPLNFQ